MTAAFEDFPQLRPGLREIVEERYPGVMLERSSPVPLASLPGPLSSLRLAFVSSAGIQPRESLPFDVAHPVGDFSYREVSSAACPDSLAIHQIKYPTHGAERDLNVVFPLDRLRELVAEGYVGELTPSFFSFIGYTMDPECFEATLAEDIAEALVKSGAQVALFAPA